MTEVGMGDGEHGRGDEAGGVHRRMPSGRPPRNATDSVPDARLAQERELDDREITEDRELNEDERVELYRDSLQQSVLPNLPDFPGFHSFWATTTNPRDSIQHRLRLGYKLIRIEDFPGWDGTGIEVGGVDRVVSMNEMVAMRVPMRLYQRYMLESHHYAPLSEEEKLRDWNAGLKADAEQKGTAIDEGEGNAALVQRTKHVPRFVD